MPALCRACAGVADSGLAVGRCAACGSPRMLIHPELFRLSIAHIDCDAFYASVEKRDRPELANKPVIVGGGVRGVVTSACYVARQYGLHSAMPMFKALKACPEAVVIRPDFTKYVAVSRAIRSRMRRLTPMVQALSIDEGVLDLAGTEALHGAAPAIVLARFALEVHREVGVSVSIGLARNRLLAKIAAGMNKPDGFAVLGSEAAAVLAPSPVRLLPGVGPALARRLAARGMATLGALQLLDDETARRLLGEEGPALCARARGEDGRTVDPARGAKSISAETTFESDLVRPEDLERPLWRMAEKLARRLKAEGLAAGGVVLKLKTGGFVTRTRAGRLPSPTALPDRLFETARGLLRREATGTAFRLIGIGAHPLLPGADADLGDLVDTETPRRAAAQAAVDTLRQRFGESIIARGRGLER